MHAAAVGADTEAKVIKMEKRYRTCNCHQVQLHPVFEFHFSNNLAFQATVDEGKIVSLMYTDESLFGIAGTVSMTAYSA